MHEIASLLHKTLLQNYIPVKIFTFSNRRFQFSSLCVSSSIQCDSVFIIPLVVALNVIASPLKSIACAPCWANNSLVIIAGCPSNTNWIINKNACTTSYIYIKKVYDTFFQSTKNL